MTIPDTLKQALVDPVIGKYVRMVIRADKYANRSGTTPIQYLLGRYAGTTPAEIKKIVRTLGDFDSYQRCNFVSTDRAISVLIKYPESAHMLDLPADALIAMAKMGSAMALAYACIVCTLEKMNEHQRNSTRLSGDR